MDVGLLEDRVGWLLVDVRTMEGRESPIQRGPGGALVWIVVV